MISRRLQRPLTRTTTSVWLPYARRWIQPSPVLFRKPPRIRKVLDDRQAGPTSARKPPQPVPEEKPLFHELFPPEKAERRQPAVAPEELKPEARKPSWVAQLDKAPDGPPVFEIPEEDEWAEDEDDSEVAQRTEPPQSEGETGTMLILSAASKALLDSDFYRLGTPGRHVEGWVSGIVSVIQARDPNTLEPLGHYYILFSSHEAAVSYHSEVERLWKLSKEHTPGSRREESLQQAVPFGGGVGSGDTPEALAARSFTLVSPSQRYDMQFSSYDRGRPTAEVDRGAATVARLAQRLGSPWLVLLTISGARLSVDTLKLAIRQDGIVRNLRWRVHDFQNGILPFGKSVLKFGNSDGDPDHEADNGAIGADADTDTNHKERRYGRFIIPFKDESEARRFTRKWQGRQLKFQRKADDGNIVQDWEANASVRVSILF